MLDRYTMFSVPIPIKKNGCVAKTEVARNFSSFIFLPKEDPRVPRWDEFWAGFDNMRVVLKYVIIDNIGKAH